MQKLGYYLRNIGKILIAAVKGVGSVILTQLILSGITFIILCIGFAVLNIPYWGFIAFAIALVDLVPLVGSGVIMIPWAVILMIMGKTDLAVPLIMLYLIIFIVRQVLEPIFNGKSIGVKPLYTFAATILAGILFGPWGLVLGPVIVVIVKTVLDIKEQQEGS